MRPLEREAGAQLVIVRNELLTYENMEWIYNDPDIDRARIVYARDMGVDKNQELIRYYPQRRVWSLVIQPGRRVLRLYR